MTITPEFTVCAPPAFAMGAVRTALLSADPPQASGCGAFKPGHGESCPRFPSDETPGGFPGELPKYGPMPFTRNGNSWNGEGTVGLPTTRFSGRMNSKFGAWYCPAIRPLAYSLAFGRTESTKPPLLKVRLAIRISRVAGRKFPIVATSRPRPLTPPIGGPLTSIVP